MKVRIGIKKFNGNFHFLLTNIYLRPSTIVVRFCKKIVTSRNNVQHSSDWQSLSTIYILEFNNQEEGNSRVRVWCTKSVQKSTQKKRSKKCSNKKVLKEVLKKALKKVDLLKKVLKKVNLLKKGLKKVQPVKKVNSRKCIQ